MTKLLKTSLLLAAAPFVLAYGEGEDAHDGNGFSLSVEVKGGANNSRIDVIQSAGEVTTPAANANGHALAFLASVPYQSMSQPVREGYDKLPLAAGARVVGAYKVADDFNMSLYVGVETGLKGGSTAGTYDATLNLANIDGGTPAAGQDATAGSMLSRSGPTLEENVHISVGARLGYHNFSLCGEYDMSKLKVENNKSTDRASDLNKEFSNNNFLFGARVDQTIDAGDFDLNLFVEGFTNFSRKADSEVTDYVKANQAAYFTDLATTAIAGKQPTEAHMNIMKLSLGLGFNFANL